MAYRVHVSRLPGGSYQATCLDPLCSGKGPSPEAAVAAVRSEIRFQLELCPCTALAVGAVEIEVVSAPAR
jgi:hypothetical protein